MIENKVPWYDGDDPEEAAADALMGSLPIAPVTPSSTSFPGVFLPGLFFDLQPTTLDTLREKLRLNLDALKQKDVYEVTLWQKYKEITDDWSDGGTVDQSQIVKAKIWTPTDLTNQEQTIEEVRALRPRIVYVDPMSPMKGDWDMLRIFVHTMEFTQNPGRFIRFLVLDEVTGKYLGAASIGSEQLNMKPRDEWIGWEDEDKNVGENKRSVNSAIATCIMPVQPFGNAFNGGKLVAALMTAPVVAETYKRIYGDTLVGLTTTSLYGATSSGSMYDGMRPKYWQRVGETKGQISLKPDDEVYEEFHHHLQQTMPVEYAKATDNKGISGPVTGIKQKILALMFKASGLSQSAYNHEHKRGIYYAELYANTRPFLRCEIDEAALVPHPRLAGGEAAIVDWWLRKHAITRYLNRVEKNLLKPEITYYNEGIGMTWPEFKARFLGEVGR